MGASNYLEEAILNAVLRGQTYTSPDTIYVALYLSDPTDEDVGSEVSGNGYGRTAASFTAPVQIDGKGEMENVTQVEFPVASGLWGTVTHFGIRDALTAGNLLFYEELTTPKEVTEADTLRFNAGELKVRID